MASGYSKKSRWSRWIMATIKDLRDFISVLETKGLLHRIKVEVDPILEIAGITDRMCKSPAEARRFIRKSKRFAVSCCHKSFRFF